MSRDWDKAQTYYNIKMWFKHGFKIYKVTDKIKLDEFLAKAHQNETVIHYVVEAVTVFVYASYEGRKYTGR